uniref:Methyltransferase type 11 domain-containing protein n=1 Tax=Pseudo-nitzschia delicatissima TaxID=44447 RepID=A0A7S0Y576_9STRA|mmetsp:Transcript_1686/g.3532  ORF Transcript_1686/g.3532 Transcript_1686/m.3532 type:complete len:293 (+) Transcript_1686:52-930(+)
MKNYHKAFAALSLLSATLSRSSNPSSASAFVLGDITRSTVVIRTPITLKTTAMSGWSRTWNDILNGGSPRWKITSGESHENAYAHFQKHVLKEDKTSDDGAKNISVLCPLAGDDPFVRLLFRKGYSVTAIDLVAEAVEAMRKGFGDEDDVAWTKEETDGDIIWTHNSGRATLIVGDALKKRPNLDNSFDAVYDKDSFGALSKDLRKPFCERIADYTKDNAIVYLECKLKKGLVGVDNAGPPFSLRKDDLMEGNNYGGSKFVYLEGLGPVYDLPGNMNAVMQQTGHVLRRTRT